MLGAVGLGPAEEDVYRRLVVAGAATTAALSAGTGQPESEVAAVLAALVERGLAVRGRDDAYAAAPPAVALGALLREQRDALYSAELDLAELADAHRSATSGRVPSDVVEVLTDVDAVRHRFAQVQQGAQREVRSMMVPNLSVVPYDDNDAGYEALRRGVRYRAILDRAALDQPGIVRATSRGASRSASPTTCR